MWSNGPSNDCHCHWSDRCTHLSELLAVRGGVVTIAIAIAIEGREAGTKCWTVQHLVPACCGIATTALPWARYKLWCSRSILGYQIEEIKEKVGKLAPNLILHCAAFEAFSGISTTVQAGTKLPHKLALYLVWPWFFLFNHFWLCAAVVSHSQPLSKWLRRNTLKL